MLRALGLPEAAPIPTTATPASAGSTRTLSFFQTLARTVEKAVSPGATAGAVPAPASAAPAIGPPPAAPDALRGLIATAARQEKIPPALLSAVVEVESGFQPHAVSRAGARGLTQLMPGTARSLGVTDSFDPWQNLVGGARFLHGLLDRYPGNLSLAVAAYNAGPGAVDAAGGQIPPYAETQKYVRLVLAAYQRNLGGIATGGIT
ncbi:MAG: lytic transglycosylase domain-containing protein [Chloroflexota bacterium]